MNDLQEIDLFLKECDEFRDKIWPKKENWFKKYILNFPGLVPIISILLFIIGSIFVCVPINQRGLIIQLILLLGTILTFPWFIWIISENFLCSKNNSLDSKKDLTSNVTWELEHVLTQRMNKNMSCEEWTKVNYPEEWKKKCIERESIQKEKDLRAKRAKMIETYRTQTMPDGTYVKDYNMEQKRIMDITGRTTFDSKPKPSIEQLTFQQQLEHNYL